MMSRFRDSVSLDRVIIIMLKLQRLLYCVISRNNHAAQDAVNFTAIQCAAVTTACHCLHSHVIKVPAGERDALVQAGVRIDDTLVLACVFVVHSSALEVAMPVTQTILPIRPVKITLMVIDFTELIYKSLDNIVQNRPQFLILTRLYKVFSYGQVARDTTAGTITAPQQAQVERAMSAKIRTSNRAGYSQN